jgi:4-aminobutyrate aminotransferase / (S)-3-amino-2-methylpropionate transaminase / 5-aminovalerate transaminase
MKELQIKTAQNLLERRNRVMPKALQMTSSINADHAKGAFFYDIEGKEYLDFSGGIGVLNAGHCPPQYPKPLRSNRQN